MLSGMSAMSFIAPTAPMFNLPELLVVIFSSLAKGSVGLDPLIDGIAESVWRLGGGVA